MDKKFGNPLGLLEKLTEFLEACRYQDVQSARPRLVARALEVVRKLGCSQSSNIKDMKDEEIQAFIDYYGS